MRHDLARADAGERFEVTLFGRPVAQLTPLEPRQATLGRLIAEGKVAPAATGDSGTLPSPMPATTGTTATEALLAERRGDAR